MVLLSGCFAERSCRMVAGDVIYLDGDVSASRQTTRPWLSEAHGQLAHLLPSRSRPAMLTEQLTTRDGRPADVFEHFKLKFDDMDTLMGNLDGMIHTAHLSATGTYVDSPAPPWPGFEDVWIPLSDDLELSGRLGFAEQDGQIKQADCIVILPGLFGDNGVLRTRDLAEALLSHGLHVLSLELRACGQTEARYPEVYTSWGVLETGDLLIVSQWLEVKPAVKRTGLVGYCWGANLALLTAWADSRSLDDPSISSVLAHHIQPPSGKRHYTAGVLAFSPVLRFEELIDQLDTPRSALFEPILHAFQKITRDRMRAKGHQPVSGSLRQLIADEIGGHDISYPDPVLHGLRYLRLLPYGDKPSGDKLECARMPVLIVQGANDPLVPAQDVAELISITENPNVAAIVVPGGGHVGLPAYAKEYYFSLIMNFFNPKLGPVTAE